MSTLLLPDLPFEAQVALARDTGYDGLTMRIADTPVHDAARLRRIGESSAMEFCALATDLDVTAAGRFAELAACARALGAPLIRITAPARDGRRPYDDLFAQSIAELDRIEEIARATEVRAVLEIRPGTIVPSASAARRLLEGFDPAHLGAALDPGGMIHEGFEPWDFAVAVLGPRLAHVSVTNAVWSLQDKPTGGPYRWAPRPARLREGQVDWRSVMTALVAAGYDGWLTLEDVTAWPAREKLDDAMVFLKALARPAVPANTGGGGAVESGGR